MSTYHVKTKTHENFPNEDPTPAGNGMGREWKVFGQITLEIELAAI